MEGWREATGWYSAPVGRGTAEPFGERWRGGYKKHPITFIPRLYERRGGRGSPLARRDRAVVIIIFNGDCACALADPSGCVNPYKLKIATFMAILNLWRTQKDTLGINACGAFVTTRSKRKRASRSLSANECRAGQCPSDFVALRLQNLLIVEPNRQTFVCPTLLDRSGYSIN